MMTKLENCYLSSDKCPYPKPHVHVTTANGSYVRYMDMTRLCPHSKQESHCMICLNNRKVKEYGDD